MARQLNKLSARGVATITKPGRHSDGGGLYLSISKDGETLRRRWVFLYTLAGKGKEMGLGPASTVSLAQARVKADEARKLVAAGIDPIEARRAAELATAGRPTFGEMTDAFLAAKASEWRNPKHRAQWRMTLEVHAASLRPVPVDEIGTESILRVLQPIWLSTPETASRLRGRIEAVLDAARAKGHIASHEANPARWKGHLDHLLAKRQHLTRGHHAAMAYDAVPEFIGKLREREATAALALEFLILTAARSGEVLGACWSEIDLAGKVWTVPAGRMKAGREHRVPLSNRAAEILQKLAEARAGEFVFPGQKPSSPLSGMAMEMLLRRMEIDVTVHGFRSSFRDWCGEVTSFPREIAEAALAHVVGNKVEAAYRRGDALEKRRVLMEAWAGFCEPDAAGNIVQMHKSRA